MKIEKEKPIKKEANPFTIPVCVKTYPSCPEKDSNFHSLSATRT
jgi:hypothetical protein